MVKDKKPEDVRLGAALRQKRDAKNLSLRAVARKLKVQPAYLSKVELGATQITEKLLNEIAVILDEDLTILMLFSGRVTKELRSIIIEHPEAFAELIRKLKKAPENVILQTARAIRDGDW